MIKNRSKLTPKLCFEGQDIHIPVFPKSVTLDHSAILIYKQLGFNNNINLGLFFKY